MKQTLSFLNVLDNKIKRSHNKPELHQLSLKHRQYFKKQSYRYPYAKAMNFTESKYDQFPKWLKEKEGFVDFMYRNYENRLLSIPNICEKELRGSQQKYLLSVYLEQVSTFSRLPQVVRQILLQNLKTRYYPAGSIIHDDNQYCQFLGVIYLGEVEYRSGKRTVVKQKNDIIMLQAFHSRTHPQIICREETVLLVLKKDLYRQIKEKLREWLQQNERDVIEDLLKSTFFTQVHIKDEKAKQFLKDLQLQFYFPEEVIEEAGTNPNKFCLVLKGQLRQENHIFVKEHNKWPLSSSQWQVRAVYNSINKKTTLSPFSFFNDQQILDNTKSKSKFVAKTFAVLLIMSPTAFLQHLNSEDLKRLKKYRTQHIEIDYNALEHEAREKVKLNTQRKKIVLKAINTVLINKTELSPKKLKQIHKFEQSMLKKPFFNDSSII